MKIIKISPFWPTIWSILYLVSEFKLFENLGVPPGTGVTSSSTIHSLLCIGNKCNFKLSQKNSDINYVQRGGSYWSYLTERVDSRNVGFHFGDKCSWGQGYKQNCNITSHKTFNESEKRKRKLHHLQWSKGKENDMRPNKNWYLSDFIVVPGAFWSPLHVNSFNLCNKPMRWVLFLFPFTEEETGTEKLRHLLQVTQSLSGRFRIKERHSHSTVQAL